MGSEGQKVSVAYYRKKLNSKRNQQRSSALASLGEAGTLAAPFAEKVFAIYAKKTSTAEKERAVKVLGNVAIKRENLMRKMFQSKTKLHVAAVLHAVVQNKETLKVFLKELKTQLQKLQQKPELYGRSFLLYRLLPQIKNLRAEAKTLGPTFVPFLKSKDPEIKSSVRSLLKAIAPKLLQRK